MSFNPGDRVIITETFRDTFNGYIGVRKGQKGVIERFDKDTDSFFLVLDGSSYSWNLTISINGNKMKKISSRTLKETLELMAL